MSGYNRRFQDTIGGVRIQKEVSGYNRRCQYTIGGVRNNRRCQGTIEGVRIQLGVRIQ